MRDFTCEICQFWQVTGLKAQWTGQARTQIRVQGGQKEPGWPEAGPRVKKIKNWRHTGN